MNIVSSLSTPRELVERRSELTIDPHEPELTREELKHAIKDKLDSVPPSLYRKVERRYADPVLPAQKFALVSFVPSPGATPDNDGIYGMMKVRGSFATADEAHSYAETLVRTVDSNHTILTTFVGRPFPILEKNAKKFGAELVELRVQEKCEDIMKKDDKQKKEDEVRVRQEMERRQEAIMKPTAPETEDPLEKYVHLRVKRAQLAVAMEEWGTKLKEVRKLAWDTHKEILDQDSEDPELVKEYTQHYIAAREQCGLTSEKDDPMMRNLELTEEQMVHLFGPKPDLAVTQA